MAITVPHPNGSQRSPSDQGIDPIYRSSNRATNLTTIPGPLAPLQTNLDFLAGESTGCTPSGGSQPSCREQVFFIKGTICPYSDLQTQEGTHKLPFYSSLQIRRFLTSPKTQACYTRQLTPFESLCTSDTTHRHLISRMYNFLSDHISPKTDIACKQWEKEGISLSEEWEYINHITHACFRNINTQANGSKSGRDGTKPHISCINSFTIPCYLLEMWE